MESRSGKFLVGHEQMERTWLDELGRYMESRACFPCFLNPFTGSFPKALFGEDLPAMAQMSHLPALDRVACRC